MKDTKIKSFSRRRISWSEIEDASLIESFIDSCNQGACGRRYISSMPAGEIARINSDIISDCRYCGSFDARR